MITDQIVQMVESESNRHALEEYRKELKTISQKIEIIIGIYLREGLMKAHDVKAFSSIFLNQGNLLQKLW